ncbi:MAG: ABC transporter substrate-binding protein [Alphaproteobacteria bacterium]|nr:ABC transporter substrate-binding protein [Alphaproteobacteria bacterium]
MRTIKVLCLACALLLANIMGIETINAGATTASMSAEQAKTFIQDLGNKALNIINRKGISSNEVCAEFKKLLEENFAMGKIEKRILGKYYKQLKDSEEPQFKNSMINMLVNVYTSRFNEYKAAKFTVTSAKQKSQNQILVDSKISVTGKQDIKVTWIIYVSDGKIYDVKIDDVSVSNIQQTTIIDQITKSGFSNFLKDFNNKYKESNNYKQISNYK